MKLFAWIGVAALGVGYALTSSFTPSDAPIDTKAPTAVDSRANGAMENAMPAIAVSNDPNAPKLEDADYTVGAPMKPGEHDAFIDACVNNKLNAADASQAYAQSILCECLADGMGESASYVDRSLIKYGFLKNTATLKSWVTTIKATGHGDKAFDTANSRMQAAGQRCIPAH